MKNKKILTSAILALTIFWLVWTASADFGNVLTQEDRETHRIIINKLIDWETLTAEETEILEEIRQIRDEREEMKTILEKEKNGEELSEDEQTKLEELEAEREAKKEEMQEKKEEVRTIIEKEKNGEELTEDEQATLDEFKEMMKHRKFKVRWRQNFGWNNFSGE